MGAKFVTVGKTNEIPAGDLVARDVRRVMPLIKSRQAE